MDDVYYVMLYIGYAFLLFNEEESIHKLVMSCLEEDDKHYMYISSPTYKEKKVIIIY